RIEQNPAIDLRTCTEVVGLEGNEHIERVRWLDKRTGKIETRDIRHIFVMTGAIPNTGWLAGCVQVDEKGVYQDWYRTDAGRSDKLKLAAGTFSVPIGNELARSVRGWRRSRGERQASRLRCRRRIDRSCFRSSGLARIALCPIEVAFI